MKIALGCDHGAYLLKNKVADHLRKGFLTAYHSYTFPGSGHSSIEQIPPQHDIVLFQKRNNDDRILLSLALMNGRTVGELQILQHFLRRPGYQRSGCPR